MVFLINSSICLPLRDFHASAVCRHACDANVISLPPDLICNIHGFLHGGAPECDRSSLPFRRICHGLAQECSLKFVLAKLLLLFFIYLDYDFMSCYLYMIFNIRLYVFTRNPLFYRVVLFRNLQSSKYSTQYPKSQLW